MKPLTCLACVRCDLGQPDSGLNGLDLTEKRPDAVEWVMAPVLEQPGGFRGDAPVIGVRQSSPLAHLLADSVDYGGVVILLGFSGKPFAFVKQQLRLFSRSLAFLGFGDRRNEFSATTGFDDFLGGLACFIQFPMSAGILVGRVQDGPFEELAIHGSTSSDCHSDDRNLFQCRTWSLYMRLQSFGSPLCTSLPCLTH